MKQKEIFAYTAGIVDGEGSIHIMRSKDVSYKTSLKYELRVSIGNTNEWLCQWLKMQFGGCVSSHTPLKPHWKRSYNWLMRANKARDFLELILPYLVIKKTHAELAIKFQNEIQQQKILKNKREDVRIIQEANYILMKSLNKKGVEI